MPLTQNPSNAYPKPRYSPTGVSLLRRLSWRPSKGQYGDEVGRNESTVCRVVGLDGSVPRAPQAPRGRLSPATHRGAFYFGEGRDDPRGALRYRLAYALMKARKIIRGLKEGLTEAERYAGRRAFQKFLSANKVWWLRLDFKRHAAAPLGGPEPIGPYVILHADW